MPTTRHKRKQQSEERQDTKGQGANGRNTNGKKARASKTSKEGEKTATRASKTSKEGEKTATRASKTGKASKESGKGTTRAGKTSKAGGKAAARETGKTGKSKPSPVVIAKALRGIDYPKNKSQIVAYARKHASKDAAEVLAMLERLPNRKYTSMAEVEQGVGEVE